MESPWWNLGVPCRGRVFLVRIGARQFAVNGLYAVSVGVGVFLLLEVICIQGD